MKTTLRLAACVALFAATTLSAQNAAQKPTTLPAGRTTSVSTQVQAQAVDPGQDIQMVACTDKVTYTDRHPQTNQDFYLGGNVGWQILFQKFPDYTGSVTAAYASLRRVGVNCPVRICVYALDGSGNPTGGYLAYVDASVNSATAAEYGGNLNTSPNVSNGFAIGVFVNSASVNDSAFLMVHNDPEAAGFAYYFYSPNLYNAQNDFSDDVDFLVRPKLSFTAPTVSASANPSSGCVGTPIAFTSYGANYPAHYNSSYSVDVYNVNYSTIVVTPDPVFAWNFGDAGTGNVQNPNHTYSAVNSYNATIAWTYTGWTTACATAPATVPVTVTGTTPSVVISASANPVCPNGTSNFTAVPTNGGNSPTYVWKKNGFQVGTGSTYSGSTWALGDIMTCEMVSNATCAPSTPVVSNQIVMYTQPIANSSFNYSSTGLAVTFTSTAANAVSWSWNFGDAGTSASATPVHNYATGGTYTVDLTVTNSCGQTTVSSINITISTSTNTNGGNTAVHENALEVNVNAFPNPVNDNLNINYSINHTADVTIEVLNPLGQIVSSQAINNASVGTAHVSMEGMASGLYFVRFTAGENSVQMMRVIHQ